MRRIIGIVAATGLLASNALAVSMIPDSPRIGIGEYLNFRTEPELDGVWLPQGPSAGVLDSGTGVYHAGLVGGVLGGVYFFAYGYGKVAETWIEIEWLPRPAEVVGPATSMDLDGAGVGLSDVLLILGNVVGLWGLSVDEVAAADWNHDGQVGLGDAINALRVVVGLAPMP